MTTEEKYKLYKQILFELSGKDWQKLNDWGLLKRTRLLYLFCAISKKEIKPELYSIFNNFYAQCLGPVENDIYNQEYEQKDVYDFSEILDTKIDNDLINNHLELFKNKNIVEYSPEKIINLTQYSTVWEKSFKDGIKQGKNSFPMLIKELIKENFLNYKF